MGMDPALGQGNKELGVVKIRCEVREPDGDENIIQS